MSNSLQPTLNLKRNRSSHWSINKLITAIDRIEDTCCRIETITGHQFKQKHEKLPSMQKFQFAQMTNVYQKTMCTGVKTRPSLHVGQI